MATKSSSDYTRDLSKEVAQEPFTLALDAKNGNGDPIEVTFANPRKLDVLNTFEWEEADTSRRQVRAIVLDDDEWEAFITEWGGKHSDCLTDLVNDVMTHYGLNRGKSRK